MGQQGMIRRHTRPARRIRRVRGSPVIGNQPVFVTLELDSSGAQASLWAVGTTAEQAFADIKGCQLVEGRLSRHAKLAY
jgi:hypothetical protein